MTFFKYHHHHHQNLLFYIFFFIFFYLCYIFTEINDKGEKNYLALIRNASNRSTKKDQCLNKIFVIIIINLIYFKIYCNKIYIDLRSSNFILEL